MSKICPINRDVQCTSKCLWRVGENCAIVDIANSLKRTENTRYGTHSGKHIDTDTIRKEVFD